MYSWGTDRRKSRRKRKVPAVGESCWLASVKPRAASWICFSFLSSSIKRKCQGTGRRGNEQQTAPQPRQTQTPEWALLPHLFPQRCLPFSNGWPKLLQLHSSATDYFSVVLKLKCINNWILQLQVFSNQQNPGSEKLPSCMFSRSGIMNAASPVFKGSLVPCH